MHCHWQHWRTSLFRYMSLLRDWDSMVNSPHHMRVRALFPLGERYFARLGVQDIEPWYSPLAQLPTEATTLLAAAALGVRGRAEIRDNADSVSVIDESADIYLLPISNVLAGNQLAQKLVATRSCRSRGRSGFDMRSI